jgi:hypothetical protein
MSPAPNSSWLPSSIRTASRPDVTKLWWRTRQLSPPTIGLTCSDHRHPGRKVYRVCRTGTRRDRYEPGRSRFPGGRVASPEVFWDSRSFARGSALGRGHDEQNVLGEFSVAQSAGGDGMESPELIWLPREAAGSHLRWLTLHETAQQWFYGLVGSDQAQQPFADEAAADMLARTASGIWRASRCPTARLDRSIYAYSARCYFEIVYVQGSGLLDEIRAQMGSTAFWAAIRGYIAAHHDGLGGTKLLASESIADATG